MAADTKNLVIGIIMIVLGALLLLGKLSFQALLPVLGIALMVVGILVLLKVLGGGTLIGIVLLVLGAILQFKWIELRLPSALKDILGVLDIVIGLVLVILGILKVMGRR